MDRIKVSTEEYIAKLAALFLASVLLALVVLIVYTRSNIIYPLNGMAIASSLELNSEEDRKKCIENMEKLQIKTGDEVEHLYTELLNNMKDTVSYMETIRQRDEDLNKLQDGLIKVLAEAVESRDLCTGNHIKRTAAYVRLIMDELQKEGYAEDVLTDEYIQSVIRSAPLHDVGKIKVPDAILNKPGRLNDEEFNTIKTHTTSGVDIIDEAINVVPNPMYLKEARDMAYYHHEKWNGKGYPCGIEGEEIPLSARVMAVADVFDALVSKRSYKKEFPIEKAFDIIEEGSGSHFDPVVVNAFMARSDDVIKLVEEFAEEEADSEVKDEKKDVQDK
jgi:response regulator RpfG family c-di-GMP phosphodiesterase